MRTQARRAGIAPATLDRAFAGLQPNQKVLDRDNHQPEFTLTWAKYRAMLITDQRIASGRAAYQQNRALFARVRDAYGVDPGVILGIWGLESSFGTGMGDFHVIEALATLAWEGRRASFFRGELMAALHILDHGDVTPAHMMGSYAGAMGQPQFMPSSYLRYAVDFEGSGKRDIWTSKPDVLASIANYLKQSGWHNGEPWGEQVSGQQSGMAGKLVQPDGPGGESFVVFGNFNAIRRYNPSDYYALAVGLLGDAAVG
jgi:membrane-bound lytic murein transglycosylase B